MNLSDYLKAERGRTSRIAKTVGISGAYLAQIPKGLRPCPVNRASAIERACEFNVLRKDLCPEDWHEIWPDLALLPGALDQPQAERRAQDRRRAVASTPRLSGPPPTPQPLPEQEPADMSRVLNHQGRTAPLRPPPAPLPGADVLLLSEVLRLAAQAAEAQCRKQKMLPMDAALAVVAAYRAARDELSAAPPADGAPRS